MVNVLASRSSCFRFSTPSIKGKITFYLIASSFAFKKYRDFLLVGGDIWEVSSL